MRRSLVLALAFASAAVARAEKFTVSTGEFGINCVGQVQLCEPPAMLVVGDPAKRVKLRKLVYTASSAHCSAGRLLIDLDGAPFGKMRFVIGKETSTLNKRRTLKPGLHTLAFRFEGRVSGCNTGFVSGWGGNVTATLRR
jgi:hypothetical protein